MTLNTQFLTLAMMYGGGLALGGLYDLYRVLSGQWKAPSWVKAVLDLLYWLVGTLLVFRMLYESNWGEVRPFIFLGLAIGITFYFGVFSRTVIRVIHFIIRAVVAIARGIQWVVVWFVVKPAIGVYRLLLIVLGFLSATAIFLYKIVLQLCYPLWKLLLWLLRPISSRIRISVPQGMKNAGQKLIAWLKRFF